MQPHVILAVFRRQLASYFASPTGYVFITIFVFLSALAAFWTPAFFDRSLANLDQLNRWFPALLVFIVPAIAMGAWAEERREGTAELLLTLPARDAELVVGKHLACVAIFTACLAFAAVGQVAVLAFLGSPDAGLLVGVYLGQWLAGAALLAVAMAASALTANLTVSFILGALLCAIVVGAGWVARYADGTALGHAAAALSLPERFADFSRGMVTLDSALYFLLLAAFGLWLNVFLIGRTHWVGAPGSDARTGLAAVRGVALAVAALSLVALAGRVALRADVTDERLWSLSPQTRDLVAAIDPERPVLVTAFVSPEVPSSYAQTRESLLGVLRELDRMTPDGRDRVDVRILETTPHSDAAREAERAFGITPRTLMPAPEDPDPAAKPVFLGVALTSGAEQAVIPFMSRGLPVEYELARSLRTVTAGQRKRVGVLDTPVQIFGVFDFQTFQPARDWPILDELRKQYNLIRVARGQPIPQDLDTLIVPQPSALTDDELPFVLDYLRAGRPAFILEDPLFMENPALSTSEPREANRNPFAPQMTPDDPKANLNPLWDLLGAEISPTRVAWDAHNPRPQLAEVPREFIFVGRDPPGTAGLATFNDSDDVTSALQEVVVLGAGQILPRNAGGSQTVTPLLQPSAVSGTLEYADVLQRSLFGSGFNPNRRFVQSPERPVLLARITGAPAPEPATEGADAPAPPQPLNVILAADLDMISRFFFQLREEGMQDLEFDNVTLALNAVDDLAGDTALVDLRKRRREHRTLERLEARRLEEQREALAAAEQANAEAEAELQKARDRMNQRVAEIEGRADLDDTTRRIMIESVRQSEQRRLDVLSQAINDARDRRVEEARAASRRDLDAIEMGIRTAAVLLPPLPALLLGGVVFARRRAREREGVSRDRLRHA